MGSGKGPLMPRISNGRVALLDDITRRTVQRHMTNWHFAMMDAQHASNSGEKATWLAVAAVRRRNMARLLKPTIGWLD